MKKILFLFALSVLALSACKEKGPHYKIDGTVTGDVTDGTNVYLMQLDKMRPGIAIDTVVITKGTFTIEGSVETPYLYNISIEGKNVNIPIFLENSPIKVNVDLADAKNNSVLGSPLNDTYTTYAKEVRDNYQGKLMDINKRAQELHSEGKLTPEVEVGLREESNNLMEGYKLYQMKFISDNPNSIASAYVLRTISRGLTPDEIEPYLSKYTDSTIVNSYFITSIKEELEAAKKVAVGQKFIDLKMNDTEGNPVALSDYVGKGKYVLIDFWASWCGPCRSENPNVVKLYNEYKNKGFEIVGVSLDREKDAWLQGIKEDGITWPQMSDLKFWDSEGVKLYSIRSIPSTILLDKEGVIIANNLRGEELHAKIAELIDGK